MLVSILKVPMKNGITVIYIPHQELLELGYANLEDFDVIKANGRYFELQGFDHKAGLWWVEEIVIPDQGEDARQGVESLGEGGIEGPRGDAQRPSGE